MAEAAAGNSSGYLGDGQGSRRERLTHRKRPWPTCWDKDDFIRYTDLLSAMVDSYRRELERDLQKMLDHRREQLTDYLFPRLHDRPPEQFRTCRWVEHTEHGLRRWLNRELGDAIGYACDFIRAMELRLVFKAVTYESLIDPRFMMIARKAFPDLPELHEENDAALAQKPLESLLL